MRKYFIGVIIGSLLLASGCATVKGFFCNPTDAQIQAANVGKAVVSSLLVAATVYSGGNAVVGLLSANAIPVFDRVVAGYCVAQEQWDAAAQALELAATQTNQLAAAQQPQAHFKAGELKVNNYTMNVNGAIDFVKKVTW